MTTLKWGATAAGARDEIHLALQQGLVETGHKAASSAHETVR